MPVLCAEVFDHLDLALLRCPTLEAEILPIHFDSLGYLEDVFAAGYPFGFELTPPTLHLRAFKGYVVTRRGLDRLPWREDDSQSPRRTAFYELSFLPPAGLSGAPLLTLRVGGAPAVVGVVLGQHRAEQGGSSMQLGLALAIEALLTIESEIIGGSIAELLFQRPRAAEGRQGRFLRW
jgi:hypothetical protein